MENKKNTDYFNGILIASFILLLIEILFFNKGIIFSVAISVFFIYSGRKKYEKTSGKSLFWIGVSILFFTIISSMAFKVILIGLVAYYGWKYYQKKQHPDKIAPEFQTKKPINLSKSDDPILIRRPWLLNNIFFGRQATPDKPYQWDDINIQTGIGDTVIDLSYTVLPKGESVISIRKIIGNVQILVPYELDVCICHTVVLGSIYFFAEPESKIFNESIVYQTSQYEKANQKMKIMTSLIIGDIEVKHI